MQEHWARCYGRCTKVQAKSHLRILYYIEDKKQVLVKRDPKGSA